MSRRTLGSAARRRLLLALLSLLWLAVPAWGTVPGQINFQGLLLDAGGQPVNGAVTLAFRLYDARTGGTALWTESHAGVQVLDGVYDVALGSSTPIAAAVLAGGSVWLEIQVGAETLRPRKQVLAVPYALRAQTAKTAETAMIAESVALPPIPPVIGFVRIEGVTGSSTNPLALDWSPVRGLSWTAANAINVVELVKGNPGGAVFTRTDMIVTMDDDLVLPELGAYAAVGKIFDTADVDFGPAIGGAGPVDQQLDLENVAIADLSRSAAPAGGGPNLAALSLTFTKFVVSTGGGAEVSYDFVPDTGAGGCPSESIVRFVHVGDSSHDFSGDDPQPIFVSQLGFAQVSNAINVVEKLKGSPGGEAASFGLLSITVDFDPCLLSHMFTPTIVPAVQFERWTSASDFEPETTITLNNAVIVQFTLFSEGDRLVQTTSFDFSKITWKHLEDAEQHWDRVTNSGSLEQGPIP